MMLGKHASVDTIACVKHASTFTCLNHYSALSSAKQIFTQKHLLGTLHVRQRDSTELNLYLTPRRAIQIFPQKPLSRFCESLFTKFVELYPRQRFLKHEVKSVSQNVTEFLAKSQCLLDNACERLWLPSGQLASHFVKRLGVFRLTRVKIKKLLSVLTPE